MTSDNTASSPDYGYTVHVRGVLDAATPKEFLDLLNALRKTLGLSYTQIGNRAGRGMSRSTAQAMLTSDSLPPEHHLKLFLKACRVTPDETRMWLNSLVHIERITRSHEEGEALGASGPADGGTRPEDRGKPLVDNFGNDARKILDAPPAPREGDSPEPVAVDQVEVKPRNPILAGFSVRALASFVVLVCVVSGSSIAMSLAKVPIEVILSVYCVIALSLSSWAAVASFHRADPESVRNVPLDKSESHFNSPERGVRSAIGE
ncbi:helix-turn-helix transcriptional regulator [Umezawaea sp.]|uniref:helix-turn-helix domain-containing protein n=1 Tax=Umezawaea sp. TaxID=1955258 RepID=UPI002ED42F3B